MVLLGAVEVGLLEHERHPEHALPEVDRGLAIGAHQGDVMDPLDLDLSHAADATSRQPRRIKPADGSHQLVGLLVALVGLRTDHAVVGVIVEQAERDLVERSLHRRDLREHVDAITVLVDHPLDPRDLPADPAQPFDQLFLRCRVATCNHVAAVYPWGYHV